MLEAQAHDQLKILLRSQASIWPQNLTLSRLIARSLRRKDKSLIRLPIGVQDFWWPGLLIPLTLDVSDIVLVLSPGQKHRLLNEELPRLTEVGLSLPIWEEVTPPPKSEIWLLSYPSFFSAFKNGYLLSKQLIFPEAELLSRRLREVMSIEIFQSDWEHLRRAYPSFDAAFLEIYQSLTRRLFVQSTREDAKLSISQSELFPLRDLLSLLDVAPNPWLETLNAINQGWAAWGHLNHKSLDWIGHLQPIEPLKDIQNLLTRSPFLMLTSSSSNCLLLEDLEAINCSVDVSVSLEDMIDLDPIQLFVPFRQPLPNTEYFADYLLEQCRRLILGIQGLTIILLEDDQLRRQLTSQLAAEFGVRVIHQLTSPQSNGVICCTCSWWIKNYEQLPTPHQLIVAMLPFASLESPLLAAQVNEYKKRGRDWFRDLLLPDVLNILPCVLQPIRGKEGRVAVLDGRLRSRSWGELVFRAFEPWTPLERLLPN
tara:strand:+ start:3757 stop:5202 length:1446 start_codon:yes stop_codon:yes gene_type:complete